MTCERYRQSVHELIDGTLGPIRRAELELHLDQCDDCRALADDLRRIHDTAASLDALEPPDRVWLQVAGRLADRTVDKMDLERALAQLPEGCRTAFVLHDVEGLEHREVAEMLGIAEGTSKSQVHKARLRLRAILGASRRR